MASKRKMKLQQARAKKRAAKESRMRAPGERSKDQQKIARKAGGGSVDPHWQWWWARGVSEAGKKIPVLVSPVG